MNLSKINRVHLIGIGGIGVSAMAKFFLANNKTVSGSDAAAADLTKNLEKQGIKIFYQQAAANIAKETDLIIYSPAVPETNPERQQAKDLNIEQLSYPEFLGDMSREYKTIAIAGTNGKSTTTAMIGKIFEKAGLDPTVIVGTQVPGFNGNLRMGQSKWLIAEACEWRAHMLNLSPQTIVLTNLEPDHLDFYKDIEDIKHYFQKFINALPVRKGFLAYNADDANVLSLTKDKGYQVKSWAIDNEAADCFAKNIKQENARQIFNVGDKEYSLKIPGEYNIYNALAAITVAKYFKIDEEIIAAALAEFPNCWRRFEILGPVKGKKDTLVVSDYGHHPVALKGVLKAAHEFYPSKRIFAVFQPHHFDRTAKLFKEFIASLAGADLLLINEIYDVAGREHDGSRTINGKILTEELQKTYPNKEIIYSPDLSETKKLILEKTLPGDLILIVGAGDIDNVARELT
ncbi:MAG: UDP-N-acetylmuramate--L-alanine ligase [Candidatus Komeilibacteria bacterium]|nr:UDP-N-acetylmuramate--L-alanine ligase [Candidatus Komeilibacteria bacterium]